MMKATQRYALYKASYKGSEDPMEEHLDNLSRMINNVGMGLAGALDRYIITMIKTGDKRRALIDIESIPEAIRAIEKDITDKVSNDMISITKEINKRLN